MNAKRKKFLSIVVCILFLFVTFVSFFYIIKETNHNCEGEDCPICESIHQAEQTLRNLGMSAITVITVIAMPILFGIWVVNKSLFITYSSLVSQKIRLND